jgi:phosphonoacetaldehyde hydrolase
MKLRAVIFDWAGTLADEGSRAPAVTFVELFRRHGLDLTEEQARGPMGIAKRDHLAALLALPAVAAQPAAAKAEVDALYREFIPLQLSLLREHGALIEGAREAVAELQRLGLRIGTTTGYDRAMLQIVLEEAARQGLTPDCAVCVSDVPAGRPGPFMCWRAAEALGVWPAAAIVKVGDTVADVEEGRNAGMWSVAVSRSGNERGLTRAQAEQKLLAAGAHAVIDSVADLPALLPRLEARLAAGERP